MPSTIRTLDDTSLPPHPAMVRQKTRDAFMAKTSVKAKLSAQDKSSSMSLELVYIGIAVADGLGSSIDIAFVIYDGTYLMDFATVSIGAESSSSSEPSAATSEANSRTTTPATAEERADNYVEEIIRRVKHYRDKHFYKFVGAGLTTKAAKTLLEPSSGSQNTGTPDAPKYMIVDKEADAVVRKALGYFGRANQPRLEVVYRNKVRQNAERYWIAKGSPLAPRAEGGADVIIVDDPQMPSLVKIAKELDPSRPASLPVLFRSHIQVRADLADQEGTPTAEVWNWVWNNVKQCDAFISHPVREFVPKNVTAEKVGYLPATTDWLDGLNKQLDSWDAQYYMHEFEIACHDKGANRLAFPARPYIIQIACFYPAKGIADVLASYAILRREYMKDKPIEEVPQLVIAGHGAINDPDATVIFDKTEKELNELYADIKHDVIVMRIGPVDQLLNVLMANAHVALQLSTREGFEVKVSEALHHGVPVIATRRGGIPLQIEHGRSGFLVDVGEHDAVANYLDHLFTDNASYITMANYAANHLYLADELANGAKKIEPNSRWINDIAREKAGYPYRPKDKETTLKRESAMLDLTHQPGRSRQNSAVQ
ncbi:uncharacterized protein ALTATR162_LOCUS2764 [Alternaria atra]|uniref:Trehalose phosphorylase n=1 Tax=Alternaria atra TaxID=119953 RepID=A0A8J2HYX3_9PLEO|nr:uncharacterized protein ALTATR162_LOCUS2764 [Alternaria atra]CAG5150755.1 unnamed protein product [Alternaria atra]